MEKVGRGRGRRSYAGPGREGGVIGDAVCAACYVFWAVVPGV